MIVYSSKAMITGLKNCAMQIFYNGLNSLAAIGYEITWNDTAALISRDDVAAIWCHVDSIKDCFIDMGIIIDDYDEYFYKWAKREGAYTVHNLLDFCTTFPPLLVRFGVDFDPGEGLSKMLDTLYSQADRYIKEGEGIE